MLEMTYLPGEGFNTGMPSYSSVIPGMYHRMPNGQWRYRCKRRGSGHTWKRIKALPKEIKVEALLLGLTL